MFERISKFFFDIVQWLKDAIVITEPEENTYCIPCTWTLSGSVYVTAPDIESAKAYVHTHRITPEIEDCMCYEAIPETEHPILCKCGYCSREYVVSPIHNPYECPYCGNGGEID